MNRIFRAGRLVLLILLIFSLNTTTKGQQPIYSEGKDFWVAFLENYSQNQNVVLKIYITSKYNTSGTASVSSGLWSQTFSVKADSGIVLEVPTKLGTSTKSEQVEKKGIHITSECNVRVWSLNNEAYTTDGSNILPTAAIGDNPEYIVTSYPGTRSSYQSEFILVSTADSSQIIISPSVDTKNGHLANQSFTITLNKGETYQVMSGDSTGIDLTGTGVRAIKGSCAMFSGEVCAAIPISYCCCDHIYKECYPLRSWGKEYILSPFMNQTQGYVFRVISSTKSTTVNIHGDTTLILNKGQYYTEDIGSDSAIYISSDKPISVIQYMKSSSANGYDGSLGDPAMLILNSNNQMLNDAVFVSETTPNINIYEFINVITKTVNSDKIVLDKNIIDISNFTAVPSFTDYSYATLQIDTGIHTIKSDSGFIAYVYGISSTDSYLNSIGMGISVTANIKASKNPVCSGDSVKFTAVLVNGDNNPSYQWKVNGKDAGTNNSIYTFSPTNNDTIICVMSFPPNACGSTSPPITSNKTTMKVNPSLPVSVTVTAGENPVCPGIPVTYTASATNGGTIPSFQWLINGVNQDSDNSSYVYIPNNSDAVSCILTSSERCGSGNPANSNTVTMTVNSDMPVSVSVSSSENSVCSGTSVTFTAAATNGGSIPSYQWQVNGVNEGVNSSTYTYAPNNSDAVTCILTSNATCATGSPASSDIFTMSVNPAIPLGISVSAGANKVCEGSSVTFTATAMNGGTTPSYQWKVNNVIQGTNSPTYFYTPANNDQIICILTSDVNCSANNPATSNIFKMNVNSKPNAVISPHGPFTVCNDTSVTLRVNSQSNYKYQWKKDTTDILGAINNIFVFTNIGSYKVIVTDEIGCTDKDSVDVTYKCPPTIIVPNVITPNGDGNNDIFKINGLPTESKLQIFNRWGTKIYENDNYNNDWDGEKFSAGTYYYTLILNNNTTLKGTVTIIR